MQKRSNKKAFTLLELILVIVVLGILGYLSMAKIESTKFNSSLNAFTKQITKFIYNGIIDPTTGYANGSGGSYCSTGFDFKEISAYRVENCAKLNFKITEIDTSPTGRKNGTKSWAVVFPEYTTGQGRIYVDDLLADTSGETFRVFIDLRGLNVTAKRKLYIEDMIVSTFEREFSTSLKNVYRKALGLGTLAGGSDSDGKITIEIKK